MLEAAAKQEVNITQGELSKILASKLPRYNLLYRLRLHDFHRFCLMERPGVRLQGNVRLTADGGGVVLRLTPKGPRVTTTGDSQFDEGRSIVMSGDKVFDDETGQYIPYEDVVAEYLDAIPYAIEEFLKLRSGGG